MNPCGDIPPSREAPENPGLRLFRLSIILRILWALVCVAMCALFASEIAAMKMRPEDYAALWAGEGPAAGVWYYASERIYLLHASALAAWFLAGVFACLRGKPLRDNRLLIVHMALSGLWLAVSARL